LAAIKRLYRWFFDLNISFLWYLVLVIVAENSSPGACPENIRGERNQRKNEVKGKGRQEVKLKGNPDCEAAFGEDIIMNF